MLVVRLTIYTTLIIFLLDSTRVMQGSLERIWFKILNETTTLVQTSFPKF